jgi:hypothetical protein
VLAEGEAISHEEVRIKDLFGEHVGIVLSLRLQCVHHALPPLTVAGWSIRQGCRVVRGGKGTDFHARFLFSAFTSSSKISDGRGRGMSLCIYS